MKKERYTCDDVEALLHEMAEHDRQCCRMSDELTERLLREIDGVANRVARERFYRISVQVVAACLVLSGFVVYGYLMHKEPVANELHADSAATDSGCTHASVHSCHTGSSLAGAPSLSCTCAQRITTRGCTVASMHLRRTGS